MSAVLYKISFYTIFYAILCNIAFADINPLQKNLKEVFDFESVKDSQKFDELHRDAKDIDDDIKEGDIEIAAKNITISKTGATELFGEGNIRTRATLVNFEKSLLFPSKDNGDNKFLLKLQNDIRINDGNSSIIYAKSVLYDSGGALHMQNTRMIDSNNVSLIAKDVTNGKPDYYIFRNAFYTGCNIDPEESDDISYYLKDAPPIVTNQSDWDQNKKKLNNNITNTQDHFVDAIIPDESKKINYDIIPKSEKYKVLENNFDNIIAKYRWSEWRISMNNGSYNKKTGDAVFNHVTFKFFDIPLLYLIRHTVNLKDSNQAKTGLLIPQVFLSGAGTQLGIMIPWYWRISHNKDFLLKANIFQDISGLTGAQIKPFITNDHKRIMSSYLQFAYTHLISKKNGMLSQYSIKGSITDQTQAINYDTRMADFLPNGDYLKGYRGHFRSKALFSITPEITIKHSFLYISDPIYSLLYVKKFLPYHTNFLTIQDVRDRSFNSLDIISWTPMLLNYQINTTPTVVTQGRSFFRTKKDFMGGYGFVDSRAGYISRSQGFSKAFGSSEIGYNIQGILANSFVRFNNSFRGNAYDTTSGGSNLLSPVANNNITSLLLGTYAQILQNSSYTSLAYGTGFGSSALGSSQIAINHPLYKIMKYGTLVIDPMISLQNNYGQNYGFFSNENSFASRLNFNNLFEKNITHGIDGFVNGSRLSFGVKTSFIANSGYKISFGGGMMETISDFGNNAFLSQQSGIYGNGLSNYVGMFGINTPGGRVSISNHHRFNVENGQLLESYTNINMNVIDKFFDIVIGHSYINKNIVFLQQAQMYNTQMMNLTTRLKMTENFIFEFIGTFSIEPVNVVSVNPVTKIITNTTVNGYSPLLGINIIYRAGCVEYGINANKITLIGVGEVWNAGFSVTLSGI